MKVRLNSYIRRLQREFLILRDGALCSLCKINRGTDVDHIDGNPSNNDLRNLRLLCHRCNLKEYYRRKDHEQSASTNTQTDRPQQILALREDPAGATGIVHDLVDYQKGSAEMKVNDIVEYAFRNYVIARLRREKEVPFFMLAEDGAEAVGCSIAAAERNYLRKLCSTHGPCKAYKNELKRKMVKLKDDENLGNKYEEKED